jgi:CBS domain containing-hemolysin-like protein
MQYALFPFIWLSQKLTSLITSTDTSHITEDEILALVKLGASAGEISQEESRMVRNIIGLDRIPVKRIMTPRNVMFSLSANTNIEKGLPEFYSNGFSRAPIYDEDREHITGYVLVQDLLNPAILDKKHQLLTEFKKRISFYPETANCLTILTEFIKKKRQIAIISDEFGGVAGLVTLEDLMETILGKEIVDERDTVDDMQKIARKKLPLPGSS